MGTTDQTPSLDLSFLCDYQQSSISWSAEGVYTARFPRKEDRPYLPFNFSICKKQTNALVDKLKHTPELLTIHNSIIMDQEQRGFIERVTDDDSTLENTHYLPHHPVKKDSVTMLIRIVYDCSCRRNGNSTSVNDYLTPVSPFLNNLCGVLLHFCNHAFALSTDIEKAFLHVKLHPDDRNLLNSYGHQTQISQQISCTYHFAVVPFGSSSSPFMLAAVLDLHLSKSSSPFAADMKQNIYVGNILSGCSTEDKLLKYYKLSQQHMSQANFNLRSWSSNSHCFQAITTRDKIGASNPTVGLLGLRWNTMTDTISLTPRQLSNTTTTLITEYTANIKQYSSTV